MMSPRLQTLFMEYDEYHRHPINRLTHKIAIPLIVFHIVAMLDWIRILEMPWLFPWRLTVAHLAYVGALAWYVSLHRKLSVIMGLLYLVCFPLGRVSPVWLVVTAAAIGWSIQLAGHAVWEKRQPAFFTNLLQALIGPLYFVAVLCGYWPVPTEKKVV